eukprot:PhF_6_TR8877/c0_g2_i1/m.14047
MEPPKKDPSSGYPKKVSPVEEPTPTTTTTDPSPVAMEETTAVVQIAGPSPLSMVGTHAGSMLTEPSPLTAQQVTERSTHNDLTDYLNEYVAEDVHGRSNAFYKVAGYEMSSDTD